MRRLVWLAALLLVAPVPAQGPGSSPVLIYVTVPPDATLAVNGKTIMQTGTERRLITPPIPLGEKGAYTLTLTYTKDGKEVTVEREVVIIGGRDAYVDLTREAPASELPKTDTPRTVPTPKKDETKVTPKVEVPPTVPALPKKVEPKVDTPPPPKKDTAKNNKKDVPYVPTPQAMVEKMLDVAGVKDGDVVYDLGSGDGRIVITAVQKHKARRGVGFEINPERVKLSRENAEKAGVAGKVEFREADVLKLKDVSEANVVTLQLLPDLNERLKPLLQKSLKPGSRVVSYDFDMGDDWKPDREVTAKDADGREHVVYLWTIKEPKDKGPAKPANIPPIPIKELPKKDQPSDKDAKPAPKKDEAKKDQAKADAPHNPPYVPTPESVVAEMLKFAGVKSGDVVYDLGCGDGRIPIAAVKDFKAKKGVGIDIDPKRIKESVENAKKAKVEDKIEFREGDVLKLKDVSEANVVTLYLFPEVNEALAPMLRRSLKPGSRIVSHDFRMGDWQPEKEITVKDVEGQEHTLFLWTIK
jgi:uncharacterized protein (TIGR03000 family)